MAVSMKKVGMTVEGMDELVKALQALGEKAPIAAEKAIDNSGQILETAISQNLSTMQSGKYWTGFLHASISHTAKHSDTGAFGSAGVYHMDYVKADYRDPPTGLGATNFGAPEIAYALEHGSQPHSLALGSRSERADRPGKSKGQDKGPHHPGHAPVPFISSAFDSNFTLINHEIDATIGEFVDGLW